MRVLVACEFSGVVRDAFIRAGHHACSSDLLATEVPGPHYQGDVRNILGLNWDMMIAHPPCTYLCWSGVRWWKGRDPQLQLDAIAFVKELLAAPIHYIALENPSGILSQILTERKCIIQPYWHGDPYSKRTCLWLKNLPILRRTNEVECIGTGHRTGGHRNRGHERSRTFPGIARAMATQWGSLSAPSEILTSVTTLGRDDGTKPTGTLVQVGAERS